MENLDLRKNSRSLLLPGDAVDGSTVAQPFQIVQDGVAQPYQMAVSSRDNLSNAGCGTAGDERHTASQRILNSRRYESDRPLRQLKQTLSNGAVPAPRGIGSTISATNPLAPYEQVDRRYGANEFSNSSPKLQARAGNLPTRMASSGQIVMRGMPPGVVPPAGFRRYTSAVENGRSAGSDQMDYARLNRGGRGIPPAPLTIHRGMSVSSMTTPLTTPTPTGTHQPHQLPRLEQHHSVTNYSRGSPSPSDTLEVTKRPLNFTPTSEAPPPYREAALSSVSSPYTPSETSSLIENGAYEGINQPALVTHAVVATRESLKAEDNVELNEQQPWYHNGSDFSIHVGDYDPPDQNDAGTEDPGIIPYSQVSNFDIDSHHRGGSGVISTRVPRFSVPNSRPFPYAEDADSSVESLSRAPQPSNTHFHTVVV